MKGSKSREIPLQDFLVPLFVVFVLQYFPANIYHLLSLCEGISRGENNVTNLSLPHCLLVQQQEHQSPVLPQFRSSKKSDILDNKTVLIDGIVEWREGRGSFVHKDKTIPSHSYQSAQFFP